MFSKDKKTGFTKVQVKVRGKSARWFISGEPTSEWITITFKQIMEAADYILTHAYSKLGDIVLLQILGIGMGVQSSTAFANSITAYGEREWKLAISTFRIPTFGMRYIDDANLFLIIKKGNSEEKEKASKILHDYMTNCYDSKLVIEATSMLCQRWEFCGTEIELNSVLHPSYPIKCRQTQKNIRITSLGDASDYRFPFKNFMPADAPLTTDITRAAVRISAGHRIEYHTMAPADKIISFAELYCELQRLDVQRKDILQVAISVCRAHRNKGWETIVDLYS